MNYLTPILTVCLCLWSLADPVALRAEVWPEEGRADDLYLNNGRLQIGIDRERGGAIFHLSDASRRKNLLNHADEGRFVQQSYYGNPDGRRGGTRLGAGIPFREGEATVVGPGLSR